MARYSVNINATTSLLQWNMVTTWMISFNEIRKRNESAAKLLQLLSFFDNNDIWYQLLKCGLRSPDNDNIWSKLLDRGLEIPDPPKWFCDTVSNEIEFSTTMQTHIDFSLVEARQGNGSYSMHPVVQDWCRKGIDVDNQDELKRIALVSIGSGVFKNTEREYWRLQQCLLPHAKQITLLLQSGWHFPHDHQSLQSIRQLGRLYRDQGMLKEAEIMYQHALTGMKDALGQHHLSTLDTIDDLGSVYLTLGKLKEVEIMLQHVLANKEKILGADHRSCLETRGGRGSLSTCTHC